MTQDVEDVVAEHASYITLRQLEGPVSAVAVPGHTVTTQKVASSCRRKLVGLLEI